MGLNKRFYQNTTISPIIKRVGLYVLCILLLFGSIGVFTSISSTFKLSTDTITNWTNEVKSSTFLYLLGMENKALRDAYPNEELPSISSGFLQLAASIKPNDPRSLLGNELPGLSIYERYLLVTGQGHSYGTPVESSPPLEEILREREAIFEDPEDAEDSGDEGDEQKQPDGLTTGDKKVVFIYNTHNYESFLPHLPDETDVNSAHHNEVNITKVSDYLAESLESHGIGTQVDETDNMSILNEKGWEYWQSYDSSRTIVQEAFASNQDIKYVFDLHRDALSRDKTTTVINGQPYAKVQFVVGSDFASNDKNWNLAKELHEKLEEKYPGLSRDVLPQGGPGNNGVYNQDLHENAILIEFGGVHNSLEELYRSADALAEVFSDYYWKDAQEVSGN
ncbi:stage II sporulation protein P [Ornithinibacillus halophilus]|uniref:Stage II sporulation protein P n=1 Tax=Ornithinibacillus halophilus TaxID=930117 RepID=A0A1M5DLN5_9BACI|nr:stage II sporulation protein P [Ornithinibacillus halophilus]SHF67682.1 stage II sporulation protein P [Ornithinibacillus halophilus]